MRIKILSILLLTLFLIIPSSPVFASDLGEKIKSTIKDKISNSQTQNVEVNNNNENNNNNVNENNINNEFNPEINVSNSTETQSTQVIRQQPQVLYVESYEDIEELPRTGLPAIAWALGGLIPAGFGFKKFKKQSVAEMSANSIWEEKQFRS